jgi:hypothetical protein
MLSVFAPPWAAPRAPRTSVAGDWDALVRALAAHGTRVAPIFFLLLEIELERLMDSGRRR